MRLLIAMMKHETNTFSPVPTDWRRFEDWGLHRGAAVPAALAGTNAIALDTAPEGMNGKVVDHLCENDLARVHKPPPPD